MLNPSMLRQQQAPPNQSGIRNECQSVVQGIQSLMGISYSGVQLVMFGSLLMEKTKAMLEFVRSATISTTNKLLTMLRIRQLLKGELTMSSIGKSVVNTSGNLGKKWIIGLRVLLLFVIVIIGALLHHMRNKIKEKELIEKEETKEPEVTQQEEKQSDSEATQVPKQNDFWNHPDEEQEQPIQTQQPPPVNYLNDLPGFGSGTSSVKPWMK